MATKGLLIDSEYCTGSMPARWRASRSTDIPSAGAAST